MKNNEKYVENLIEQGLEALDGFDTQKAIEIGKKLKNLKNTFAFEILALAYKQDEKPHKAIEALKEGIETAPNLSNLWEMLGNYHSDFGDFTEALESYDRALECDDKYPHSIIYNKALAYFRKDDLDNALKQLDLIDINHLEKEQYFNLLILVYVAKIDVLNEMDKLEEACEVTLDLLKKKFDHNLFRDELSAFYTVYAETLWGLEEEEKALDMLWLAINLNKTNEQASYMIREIENKYSKDAKYFRILIQGTWPPMSEGEEDEEDEEGDFEDVDFFASYDVVAETLEDAFAFIKKYEPEYLHDSLRIDAHEILDHKPDGPLGVYAAHPL